MFTTFNLKLFFSISKQFLVSIGHQNNILLRGGGPVTGHHPLFSTTICKYVVLYPTLVLLRTDPLKWTDMTNLVSLISMGLLWVYLSWTKTVHYSILLFSICTILLNSPNMSNFTMLYITMDEELSSKQRERERKDTSSSQVEKIMISTNNFFLEQLIGCWKDNLC